MHEYEPRLLVKIKGDVAYIRFRSARILSEPQMKPAYDQLVKLVDEYAFSRIMLNFADVEYLSSSWLGKLINLHKRLQDQGIQLCMCNVSPQIFEIFQVTKLDRFFNFRETDEDDEEQTDEPDDDEGYDDGGAGVPSPLNRPKPSGGDAVILPFPPPEQN